MNRYIKQEKHNDIKHDVNT